MGLAKLSDGASSTQKQPKEKRWTKKGAAIVAELLKTHMVSTGIIQPDSKSGYVICCITDVLNRDRLFSCEHLDEPFTLKTSKWEEQGPDSFLVGVTSYEGTEVFTTLLPGTKIQVHQPMGVTDTYDAETILSLERFLPVDWEHPSWVELSSEPNEEAEEMKKSFRARLAKAIGIPSIFTR